MTEAAQSVEVATAEREVMQKRHEREHTVLLSASTGPSVRYDRAGVLLLKPNQEAEDTRTRAVLTRAEAGELRSRCVTEAVERIEAKNTEREHWRREAAGRRRQLPDSFECDPDRRETGRIGPTRSL